MAKFFTPSRLSENIRETPEGYLLCLSVPIARTGWQEYGPGETPLEVGEDGVVWVYRAPDEVFKPQTIASYQGKSVTIKHPNDFVDPKNWKMLTHGVAQNVRRGDEKDEDGEEMLLADLLITDDFAIGMVRNGLREVSCGYDAEYEQTGEGEGKQFNIVGNHIALVEQGRAGSSYAIKDHKGKVNLMNLKELAEKFKGLSKTVDEALAAEDKKVSALDKAKKKAATSDEAPEQVTYDDLMKAVKDLGEKMDGYMSKSGDEKEDEEKPKDEDMEEKEKPKDEDKEESEDDGEAEGEILERVKKLEAAVAKMLKAKAGDEDEEESEDEDMSGEEESKDEDMEESEDEACDDEEGEEGEESQKKTGDASRIEILTPGQKFKGADARSKCLKAFAKTEDGKAVLKQLNVKTIDSKTNTDVVFFAASTLMKAKRGTGLAGSRDGKKWKSEDVDNTASEPMTAEKLNEINAKHFGVAK